MRLIVAGSRSINDKETVFRFIDETVSLPHLQITEIVCGGAYGVDTCAEQWAQEHHLPCKVFYPNYKVGKPSAAPLIRNHTMAEYGDFLLAIWDGKSRGTEHMINAVRSRGKKFIVKVVSSGSDAC